MLVGDMGQYAHGNQPIQHAIYLCNWLEQPLKTQMRAREIMDKLYSSAPDGLVAMKIMDKLLLGMFFRQ